MILPQFTVYGRKTTIKLFLSSSVMIKTEKTRILIGTAGTILLYISLVLIKSAMIS